MANVFDQFDEASASGNVFDQFDAAVKPSVKPGDVEARRRQVQQQAAQEQPNVARERLGIFSELGGGIGDTASAIGDVLTPEAYQGPLNNPLSRAGLGVLRTAASPLAPLTNVMSEAGEATHSFLRGLGLETGADIGAGLVQSVGDVLAPIGISKAAQLAKTRTAGLVSPRQKAAALKQQLAQREGAAQNQLVQAKADLRRAPREAEEAIAARQSQADAARESIESIAEAGMKEVPDAATIRARFAKDAPLGEKVGEDFKNTYTASRKAKAKEFNEAYDEALKGTNDIEVPAEGYKAAIGDVLGEKGVSRPLPTQAERVAGRARGALDVEEDVADQLAALEDAAKNAPNALAKTYADEALKEFVKANPLPDKPTVRELVLERQRIKAAMRIASQTKNDNLYRQFSKLEQGISADIPDAVRSGLKEVDARYLEEFVPFYGKRSVTRAIAEGSPEKVVESIIRPATDKKAVEKVSRAWELMDIDQRVATQKAFLNKGIEDAFVDGAFDPKKFTSWWKRYSDPTGTGDAVLKKVFGDTYDAVGKTDGYNGMKSVISQMQNANRMSLDEVAAKLTKGFEASAKADIKSIQSGVNARMRGLREDISAGKTAQKLMKQHIEKQLEELVPSGRGERVAQRLESIGSGIVASGSIGSLMGSPGAMSRVIAGNILILSAKGFGALMSSAKGRAPLKAMLRATPGTSQAAAAARQVQNALKPFEEK